MYFNDSSKINYLDKIRYSRGNDALLEFFNMKVKQSTEDAIKFLNDDSLNFASLYSLINEVKEYNFTSLMSARNKMALEITEEILVSRKNTSSSEYFSSSYVQIVNSVLKWMLETGYYDDGYNDDFDEVLDICAAQLIKTYRDKAILPILADMIFTRHRKGTLTHNLVWAFFEAHDPCSLIYIANYLQSSEDNDVRYANKLLSFVPGLSQDDSFDKENHYSHFLNWLEENCIFLYYTGESLQQTSKPTPYKINLQAKYLHKIVSPDTGNILKPLTSDEYAILNEFNKLDEKTKSILSNYSYMLHNKDKRKWTTWIHYPISNQIQFDSISIGGHNA
jgi:hypothetical protein